MAATGIAGLATEALNARLATLVLSPVMPIAWPNVSYTPALTGYLEPSNNRNVTEPTAFRTNVLRGIYQVSVRKPLNGGFEPADNAADAIVAHFARGTWIVRSGVTVRVQNSYAAGAIKEEKFWLVPVIVDWFVQNNL